MEKFGIGHLDKNYKTKFYFQNKFLFRHNQISDLHKQNLDKWRKNVGGGGSSRPAGSAESAANQANSQVNSMK
jgi:hypothetical protein